MERRECSDSIYVVCEGSKSEPWFLRRFIESTEQLIGKKVIVEIYPTPKSREENLDGDSAKSKGRRKNQRKTSGRAINKRDGEDVQSVKETPKGGNPLYWVLHGKDKLNSYSEVFVVFDKDGHPKMKDAFDEATIPVDGKKVTVILNSRSFEYYMLLHFERIFRTFEKTECGEKDATTHHTRYFRCCLQDAVTGKACGGDICINGYARINGYWIDSKDEHTFTSATNIWRGIDNGEVVRYRALAGNPDKVKYELNPYVEFQDLLARLMDMSILRNGDIISKDCGRHERQSITRDNDSLIIDNGSSVLPLSLDNGWIEYFKYPEEIVRFKDFQCASKSTEEKEKAYTRIQFSHESIAAQQSIRVSAQSITTVPLFSEANDNVFAILSFDCRSFLIFPAVR